MSLFNIEFMRHAYVQGQYSRSCMIKTEDMNEHHYWQNVKTTAVPDTTFKTNPRILEICKQFDYTKDYFCIGEQEYSCADHFDFAQILRIVSENPQEMHILRIMEIMFYVGQIAAIQKYWPNTVEDANHKYYKIFSAFDENEMNDMSNYICLRMVF